MLLLESLLLVNQDEALSQRSGDQEEETWDRTEESTWGRLDVFGS